jgi:hypothetical protein
VSPRIWARGDERGAILLIAVFFAIFAVALVFSVVGTAESLLYRERMQDAADQAALSGALMHARSMNLIVLINIVMAALLAILVTIKLLEGLAIIGMAIAAGLAWFTAGASLVFIPPLQIMQSDMNVAYEQAKPPIDSALEALNDAADAVKTAAPIAANGVVLADIANYSSPPVDAGLAVATRSTLPVEDEEFKKLCEHSAEVPGTLAGEALKPLHLGKVGDLLAGAMKAMATTLPEWFCGESGQSPPGYRQSIERFYPRMAPNVACEEAGVDGVTGSANSAQGATSKSCDAATLFQAEAEPDKLTGSCQSRHDCSPSGPYEQQIAQARVECDPSEPPAPFVYEYQRRRARVPYTWTGRFWKRGEPTDEVLSQVESKGRPPCGPSRFRPVVAAGYNTQVRREGAPDVLPVCTTESPPEVTDTRFLRVGEVRSVEVTEVRHILGCKRNELVEVKVKDDKSSGDQGEQRSSKRIENTLSLGDEDFQVRALMHGSRGSNGAEQMVRLALWHEAAPDEALSALRGLGNYSIAQAEYFYDGTEGRDAWMWNMNWRGRLRRFRLPSGDALEALHDACQERLGGSYSLAAPGGALNDECGTLFDALAKFDPVLAH